MRQVIYLPLIVLSFCLFLTSSFCQNVGIGTPNPAAKLHVKGTANSTQLIVEASTTQSSNQPLILLRDKNGVEMMRIHADNYTNSYIGYYAGSNSGIGSGNTAIGTQALTSNTSSSGNVAIGFWALTTQSFNPGFEYFGTNLAIGDFWLAWQRISKH